MNNFYATCSDENILALISEQDDELAFAELYDRYFKTLFNYAYSKVNDRFTAQEIVQGADLGAHVGNEADDEQGQGGAHQHDGEQGIATLAATGSSGPAPNGACRHRCSAAGATCSVTSMK